MAQDDQLIFLKSMILTKQRWTVPFYLFCKSILLVKLAFGLDKLGQVWAIFSTAGRI